MKYIAVIIITALGYPPFQLDDQLKPDGYDTPDQCWVRTTAMIRDVVMRTNVTYASGVCINNPVDKKPKKEAPQEKKPILDKSGPQV